MSDELFRDRIVTITRRTGTRNWKCQVQISSRIIIAGSNNIVEEEIFFGKTVAKFRFPSTEIQSTRDFTSQRYLGEFSNAAALIP